MVKSTETESRRVAARGGGGEGELFTGDRVSVLQDEKLWTLVAQQCEYA